MTTIVLACVTTDAEGVLVVVGPGCVVELVLDVEDVLEEAVSLSELSLELELSFESELELELEFEFEFELEPDTLPGLLFNPVRATDQELDPPPNLTSVFNNRKSEVSEQTHMYLVHIPHILCCKKNPKSCCRLAEVCLHTNSPSPVSWPSQLCLGLNIVADNTRGTDTYMIQRWSNHLMTRNIPAMRSGPAP